MKNETKQGSVVPRGCLLVSGGNVFSSHMGWVLVHFGGGGARPLAHLLIHTQPLDGTGPSPDYSRPQVVRMGGELAPASMPPYGDHTGLAGTGGPYSPGRRFSSVAAQLESPGPLLGATGARATLRL